MSLPPHVFNIALWLREDLRVEDHLGICQLLSYLETGGDSKDILCYFIWDSKWPLPLGRFTGTRIRTWLEDQFRRGPIPSDPKHGLHCNDPIQNLLYDKPNLNEVLHIDPDQIPRMGPYRSERLAAGIFNLSQKFNRLGLKLNLFFGQPLEILKILSAKFKFKRIYAQKLVSADELFLERSARVIFSEAEFRLFSSELICEEDFETLCNAKLGSFTKFRLQVEKEIKLAAPLAVIEIPASEQKSSKLIDFKNEAHPCEMIHFTEGEYYLNWYFESPTRALRYKETRDALMGFHHSTKFSLFLNFGFLSPRQILARLKAFEAKHGTNESTYWIFFELLWREYFRLYGYKYGSKIFKREGPKSLFSASASTTTSHQDVPERIERKLFWSWALGLTEFSFINACMNELRTTGWLSNRGRQNAASYLAKTLKVNWVWGAKWFEYCLLDYDACSNWGNWNYLAGVGSDPRNRTFNVDFQATRYDPEGLYQARFSSRA